MASARSRLVFRCEFDGFDGNPHFLVGNTDNCSTTPHFDGNPPRSTLLGGNHWLLQYNSTLSGISPIISRWRRIDTPTDQTELRTWQRLTRKVISISASLHLDLPENDIKPIYHPVRNLLCTVHSTTRIWLLQPNSWLIAPLYCNVVFPKCKVREALCKNETV